MKFKFNNILKFSTCSVQMLFVLMVLLHDMAYSYFVDLNCSQNSEDVT